MAKCQLSLGEKSARSQLNTSALSSLLFCLSFALNGYVNDAGCLLFFTLFYHYEREKERWGG